MRDSKTYSSNNIGIEYIQGLNKGSRLFLFLILPILLLCILFSCMYLDGTFRVAAIVLIVLLIMVGINGGVTGRAKSVTLLISKINFREDTLSIDTFNFLVYQSKHIDLSNKTITGKISRSIAPDLGEIYEITHDNVKYVLVRQFFDEYVEIVNQIK